MLSFYDVGLTNWEFANIEWPFCCELTFLIEVKRVEESQITGNEIDFEIRWWCQKFFGNEASTSIEIEKSIEIINRSDFIGHRSLRHIVPSSNSHSRKISGFEQR
jgi:hypothetical protein